MAQSFLFLRDKILVLDRCYFQTSKIIREHQQETFLTLTRFWLLKGWGGDWGNLLKKENLWRKFVFQMLYDALKISENDSVYMPNTFKN